MSEPTLPDRGLLLEEEAFLIRHSGGEIPEVALHSSRHYLEEDPEGPGLRLTADEQAQLAEAVVLRYCAIILRDLDPGNRDRRLYRGLARAAANWGRLVRFAAGRQRDLGAERQACGRALVAFLAQEHAEVTAGRRPPSINCPASQVAWLLGQLGCDPSLLPADWPGLCPRPAPE
ncbi:MAG: hypothetical protein AB1634_08175 [Thermodesulfobacteriota bacterium]